MTIAPKPNTLGAIDFLLTFHPEGVLHLVAIYPDVGRVEAKTFRKGDEARLRTWIDERQGKANLYFHVNRLKTGVTDRKARKDDVEEVLWLHVDVDDTNALELVKRFTPQPTVINFSGGGYQAFWRLEPGQ